MNTLSFHESLPILRGIVVIAILLLQSGSRGIAQGYGSAWTMKDLEQSCDWVYRWKGGYSPVHYSAPPLREISAPDLRVCAQSRNPVCRSMAVHELVRRNDSYAFHFIRMLWKDKSTVRVAGQGCVDGSTVNVRQMLLGTITWFRRATKEQHFSREQLYYLDSKVLAEYSHVQESLDDFVTQYIQELQPDERLYSIIRERAELENGFVYLRPLMRFRKSRDTSLFQEKAKYLLPTSNAMCSRSRNVDLLLSALALGYVHGVDEKLVALCQQAISHKHDDGYYLMALIRALSRGHSLTARLYFQAILDMDSTSNSSDTIDTSIVQSLLCLHWALSNLKDGFYSDVLLRTETIIDKKYSDYLISVRLPAVGMMLGTDFGSFEGDPVAEDNSR